MRCTLNVDGLNDSLKTIRGNTEIAFEDMKPPDLPETAGVYLITVGNEPYYVGYTINLCSGLYKEQLMGNIKAASLKRYLVRKGECRNLDEAKDFLRQKATVRWILEENMGNRYALRRYFRGVLHPKYGIT
jgi:hypothetical protein